MCRAAHKRVALVPFFRRSELFLIVTSRRGVSASEAPFHTKTHERCRLHLWQANHWFELLAGAASKGRTSRSTLSAISSSADFQVITRLEIHPERRAVVEVARETKGRVSSNWAFSR